MSCFLSIQVDGVLSRSFPLNAGVPQGSIFAPILLLFISDISASTSQLLHYVAGVVTFCCSLSHSTFRKGTTNTDQEPTVLNATLGSTASDSLLGVELRLPSLLLLIGLTKRFFSCSTVAPTSNLQSLPHHSIVASLSRWYFGFFSLELILAVLLLLSFSRFPRIQVTIYRCRTVKLGNNSPLSFFPTTYNFSVSKIRISKLNLAWMFLTRILF